MDSISFESAFDFGPASGILVAVLGVVVFGGILVIKYGEEFNAFVNSGFLRQTAEIGIQVDVAGLAGSSAAAAAAENIPEDATNNNKKNDLKLAQQVEKLKVELDGCRKTMEGMTEETSKLRKRCRQLMNTTNTKDGDLTGQAKSQLERQTSSPFEDLSLGDNRPSMLIRRYSDIYAESRMEAWEALDDLLPDMSDIQKDKLLFSVVVICFKNAEQRLEKIRSAIRRLLGIEAAKTPDNNDLDAILENFDTSVRVYFRKTLSQRDYTDDFQLITTEMKRIAGPGYASSLKDCEPLNKYIWECMELAWCFNVQSQRYVIKHDFTTFDDVTQTRFHISNPKSVTVKTVLWPALFDEQAPGCLCKAVVIT